MTSADSCRTRKIEGVGTVELVCVGGKIENGDEPFLLAKKSWMFGWSGQSLDGQETSMRAEWAKSQS